MKLADTIRSYGPGEYSGPRTNKRGRGRAADTVRLGEQAFEVLEASSWPMTLRQVYYALVSVDAIPKDDAGYRKLGRVMRDLREDGTIPWEWVVDNHRTVFTSRSWDGLDGLLVDAATMYRRDLMRSQPVAIQLWGESDSIASVISHVADDYCIPTFVGRGFASSGFLWSGARDAVTAKRSGKEVVIMHVGDYDPSGEGIFRDVETRLRTYALAYDLGRPAASIPRLLAARDDLRIEDWTDWLHFDRLALTPDQIRRHRLPGRPPKASDTRTKGFSGSLTVEVEALPVDILLDIVRDAIVDLIDPVALAATELAEESEREIAKRIAATPLAKLVEAAS